MLVAARTTLVLSVISSRPPREPDAGVAKLRRLGTPSDRQNEVLDNRHPGRPTALLAGVPGDLEEMPVGVGEVPGVHAERTHMRRRGQRAASGLGLAEQPVDLLAGLGGNAQAGALIQREQQTAVEGEDGDRTVGAGDLVVEFLPDDAVGRPAKPVAVEG